MTDTEIAVRTYSTRSLHGQVAHEIGERILRGDLLPGQSLPNEAHLSEEMNVSRTALREAIKVLTAKGLLESRPKTGTRVRTRNNWNMLDPDILSWLFAAGPNAAASEMLFEIREIFEPSAAALAASRASKEQVADLRSAYDAMEAAGDDIEASVPADLRFHQLLLASTGNELLISLGYMIETALAANFKASSLGAKRVMIALPKHKAVLEAIAAGDTAGAQSAVVDLLDDARRAVADFIADNPDD
ncbi:MAG: FadR family transcriptional regulator [Alphaproteobacteria bacterium]|jgi:DNA-binding FadR family transcriptional regulator|nr:FadR family transcriptional regulator [Alphaproteobacteria bacterium]MBT4018101.1 FadR family transcriptional regulator [Alphaproteobacteria bacterium]MBT4965739.1 FadR family transcriptional regulator [Alphaproteobacteria bacterium]MBT6384798.1 FadR family transcriptional regulator [Alphaproteobacteria bacterium]